MAMFSKAQLDKFSAKRISQETFDAAVKENMEEFDMEPEEALTSAVEEFTARGVDLSNIIKTVAGGDISAHPATAAVAALAQAAQAGDAGGAAVAADAVAAALCEARGAEAAAATAAVLHKAGAAAALVEGGDVCADAPAELLRVLRAHAAVLGGGRDLQAGFLQAGGVAALKRILASHGDDAAATAAALQVAAACGVKSEAGKAALMAAGFGAHCQDALQRHAGQPEALQAACAVLCTLTNPDDDSQPASRAFPNARELAKEGAATQLVAALRGHADHPREATTALATALKQVAANDDICQEVAAAGGVGLALSILRAGLGDAALARPLCALLRQLVSSDSNKQLFVEGGGLELLAALLSSHSSSPAVLEQGLGLLTNATLRYPEAAEKASDCGCLDAVLDLMRAMLAASGGSASSSSASLSTSSGGGGGKENRGATAAQRQACMAIRNVAARSPDVRAALLDKGAEGVLRQVKVAYPSCAEAGSAALRDLGLADYNS